MSNLANYPSVQKVIESELKLGSALGIQIYVSVNRQEVLNQSIGYFVNPAQSFNHETLMRWMSAGKPLLAVALARLKDAGKISSWDDPVANYWPEFGSHGKSAVTLKHLLVHTGAFRNGDRLVSQVHPKSWEVWTDELAKAPLEDPNSQPGAQAAYHTGGSWLVLGEVLRRVSAYRMDDVVQAFREWVLDPAGMLDTWVGMPEDVYERYRVQDQLGSLHYTSGSEGAEIREHPKRDQPSAFLNCQPGGGVRGPIQELGLFYEKMLDALNGKANEFLSAEAAREITSRVRKGMFDATFQSTLDWGLGFMLNSSQHGPAPYQFGPHASASTFGHGGSQCSIGFADPEKSLVVAWVWNTTPGEPAHQRRNLALNQAIYEDLGI